jgi:hypothetical protein
MKLIFSSLYDLHPAMPVVWFLLLANGLLAPAIYCALAKLPYDISRVWHAAREGRNGAKYAICSWVVFIAATAGAFVLATLRPHT